MTLDYHHGDNGGENLQEDSEGSSIGVGDSWVWVWATIFIAFGVLLVLL